MRICGALAVVAMLWLAFPATGSAQAPVDPKSWGPIIRTVPAAQLSEGPLYWRLQTFATRVAAEAAAGLTGQVGEAEGQVWLFTLGAQGEAPVGGTLVAEIGPLAVPTAAEYALRILYTVTPAGGVGGAAFAVHSHPGTESWYVAAGEQMVWTPGLAVRTEAGQNYAGRPGGTPMILVNTGGEDRRAFTLLVVDAAQPSLSPAIFP